MPKSIVKKRPEMQIVAPGDPMFKVKAAARSIDVSDRTFRRMMALGKIGYVKHGRYVRIPLSEINKYFAQGMRPAREEKSA